MTNVLVCSNALVEVEVNPAFVNHVSESFVNTNEYLVFRARTCNRFDTTYTVTAEMFLPGNPQNDPNLGVVHFALSAKHDNTVSTIKTC